MQFPLCGGEMGAGCQKRIRDKPFVCLGKIFYYLFRSIAQVKPRTYWNLFIRNLLVWFCRRNSAPRAVGTPAGTLWLSALFLTEIIIPFHRQEIFLFIVAFLASGDQVVLNTFAAPDYGHDVVHSQLSRGKASAAVFAASLRQLALPPCALAQLPSFPLFLLYLFLAHKNVEIIHYKIDLPGIMD